MSEGFWVGFALCWLLCGLSNAHRAISVIRRDYEVMSVPHVVWFLALIILLGPIMLVSGIFE